MTLKPRKCKHIPCGKSFTPRFLSTERVCSTSCAIKKAQTDTAKKQARTAKAAQKASRAVTRVMKEQAKTPAKWLREAQKAFNAFIRLRDKDLNCISCGITNEEAIARLGNKTGGVWDCGHYRTRGACLELRFHPDNAHKQCKKCNAGSGKYSRKDKTVKEIYRANLIVKIGQARLDWVEGPHPLPHLTIEEIKAVKSKYTLMAKALAET